LVLDDKGHPVGGIVWCFYGLDFDPVECEFFTGLEITDIVEGAEVVFYGLMGSAGDVDGQFEFPLIYPGTTGVVGVVVGDNDGVNLTDFAIMDPHALLGPFAGDPGVEKQSNVCGLDVDGVAVGSALQ
jgi:hypothetical protein